jgi:acrylyl-CoA reductase (NADPH)
MTFKALLATKTGEKLSTSVVEMTEQDLMPGDVTVVSRGWWKLAEVA